MCLGSSAAVQSVPLSEKPCEVRLEHEKAKNRKICSVYFADEVGANLEEVIEVESFAEENRFTRKDMAKAEASWRKELLAQLADERLAVQQEALQRLEGALLDLAASSKGSRLVLKAIQVADYGAQQESLAAEFRGHACSLALSPHGSEILQALLDSFDPGATSFIAEELFGPHDCLL